MKYRIAMDRRYSIINIAKQEVSMLLFYSIVCLFLLACKNTTVDVPNPKYTVIFDSQGESSIPNQVIMQGELLLKPIDPIREYYIFAKWYKEAAFINEYYFDTDTINANMTIFAKWVISSAPLGDGFTIYSETVFQINGDIASSLNFNVTASVHGNTISTGSIVNGLLSITIPKPDESFLKSQIDGSYPTSLTLTPNTIKTGQIQISFVYNSITYEMVKGEYNAIYGMFDNTIGYVYSNAEATMSGNNEEYSTISGIPSILNIEAIIHFMPGWNRTNTPMTFILDNTALHINGKMTTTPNITYSKWYYKMSN